MFVIYSLNVSLEKETISCAGLVGENSLLPPYPVMELSVIEKRFCPFCGTEVIGNSCNCEDFQRAFRSLQRSYGDSEGKISLKDPDCWHDTFCHNVNDLPLKITRRRFGSNFWDKSDRFDSYLVVPQLFDGKKASFFVKNIETKEVYKCRMPLAYSCQTVVLGEYYEKMVTHYAPPHTLGNYHFESVWNTKKTFSNWNEVCVTLLSLYFGGKS